MSGPRGLTVCSTCTCDVSTVTFTRQHWFNCKTTLQMQAHPCQVVLLYIPAINKRYPSSCQPAMITHALQFKQYVTLLAHTETHTCWPVIPSVTVTRTTFLQVSLPVKQHCWPTDQTAGPRISLQQATLAGKAGGRGVYWDFFFKVDCLWSST